MKGQPVKAGNTEWLIETKDLDHSSMKGPPPKRRASTGCETHRCMHATQKSNKGTDVNGAEFKAKKRTMGISSHKLGELCGGVDRVTIERWEKGSWELPADAAIVMDDLWDKWLDRLGMAMETADDAVGDSGADSFEIAIFRTQQLFSQHFPSGQMTWGEHTAFQEALILSLALSDVPVIVEHAEDVLAR